MPASSRPANAFVRSIALVLAVARRNRFSVALPYEEADIEALLAARRGSLNLELLRDYYRLFGRERDLARLLHEADES